MEESFYKDGLRFSCSQCARCCCGTPGVVFLNRQELTALSEHEQLTPEQFIKVFCRWIDRDDGTQILSLRENSRYECIFWKEGEGCSVYELRPVQCRTYPFWSNVLKDKTSWDKEKDKCPGINEGQLFSKEDIDAELKKYEGRVHVTRGASIGRKEE